MRKFSSSTGFLASLPPSSGPVYTLSSPMHSINPTLSLPVTPIKLNDDEAKMTDGTSGYLSDSPPSDKGSNYTASESSLPIGACRPGSTRALSRLIMFQVVLVLSKLGFTIAKNQRK